MEECRARLRSSKPANVAKSKAPYRCEQGNEERCVVCYEPVKKSDFSDLGCGHGRNVHMTCWHDLLIRGKPACPVCRVVSVPIDQEEFEEAYEETMTQYRTMEDDKLFKQAAKSKLFVGLHLCFFQK